MEPKGTGALKSPYDIRTFSYTPTPHILGAVNGGKRWELKDIEDQKKVGICTAISLTMRARKHYGIKFSADFQYLLQKKEYDKNWDEGSSAFHAIKVGKNFGFLPEIYWTWTTEADRKLSYSKYIKKLQAIPDAEIERLKDLAEKYKIKAYASVPVNRDTLASAIDQTGALLERFELDNNWYREPIEPLRKPAKVISGHLVNGTNYAGRSFRIANSWGDWADNGTAYHLFNDYQPTEAWAVWFDELPKEIEKKLESRESIMGKLLDLIQQLINALKK